MKKKLLAIIGSCVLPVLAVSCSEGDDKSVSETAECAHSLPLADSIYVPGNDEMSTAVQVCPSGKHATGSAYSVFRVFGNDFSGKGEKHFVTKLEKLTSLVSELEKRSLSAPLELQQEYVRGTVVHYNEVQSSIPVCVLASPETTFSEVYRIFEATQPAGTRDYWFAASKCPTADDKPEDCLGVLRSWFGFGAGSEDQSLYYGIRPLIIYIDEDNAIWMSYTSGVEKKLSLKDLDERLAEINAEVEYGREKCIVLRSHANAQYQSFIDVVAVLNQQKCFMPVVGVEMEAPDGTKRSMGYGARKRHNPIATRKHASAENVILEEISPSVPLLVSSDSPAISMPIAISMADMSEGLSLDIDDDFGSGDLGGDFGDGLGCTVGGGSTLEGTFYDLKKLKNGKKSELKGGPENRNAVIEELSKFFANWDRAVIDKYYQGEHHLYASNWYLPIASADYGPIAFGVGDPKEKDKTKWECEPSAWLVVYRGEVIAPKSGYFRFVGTGDDFLAVRFNEKTVLDAGYCLPTRFDKSNPSRALVADHGEGDNFRAEIADGKDKARAKYKFIKGIPGCKIWDDELGGLIAGTPFKVEEWKEYPVEIAIAEMPGGKFGFVLFIEEVDSKGEPVEKGVNKKYDLFRTCDANPDIDKVLQALKDADCYIGDNRIPFNEESWVWEVVPEY